MDGKQDGSNLLSGGPVVLEDVKADSTESVNVGVVDLGQKADLRGAHWVVFGQEQLELEHATLVRALCGAVNGDIEVADVVLVGHSGDSGDGI